MFEHIPIFCATDENYAPFASLMIKSVLMHTDSFIDFYIMDGGIPEKTKKLIAKDVKKYPNKKLHFIDMTQYDLSRFPDIGFFSVNTFSRYFIPEIAPNLSKIIYLDVDIIVKANIKELFDQDLESFAIAAVAEDFFDWTKDKLKKEVFPPYSDNSYPFNAGVLLIDVQKLIRMNFNQKAIALTSQLCYKLVCADQDVLNILFEQNYKKLDYRFNFFSARLVHFKKNKTNNVILDPVVIHYTSLKPWKENSPFKEDFDAVLKTSVFCKKIIKKYQSKKTSKFYLFGFIPLFSRVVLKK